MAIVQTMKGPLDSSKLGRVLVHEHITAIDVDYTFNYRADFNEAEIIEDAVARLNEVKSLGIDTIIDLTVIGIGRNIPRVEKIAARTDLNIIVATGCYTYSEVPLPLRHVGPGLVFDRPDPMPDLFVNDIVNGIMNSKVKAGELKCAIDEPGMTAGVERVMRAVAKANLRTGVPITVHTSAKHRNGLDAQRVFKEEGVDLRDIIIGHCGDTADLDYLMRIADQGSILGMDRFGADALLSFDERIATILALVERGYLDRIAISHDCFCFSDVIPADLRKILPLSYAYISKNVLPALLKAGLSQKQIDTILIDNPRRHFEGAAERFAAK